MDHLFRRLALLFVFGFLSSPSSLVSSQMVDCSCFYLPSQSSYQVEATYEYETWETSLFIAVYGVNYGDYYYYYDCQRALAYTRSFNEEQQGTDQVTFSAKNGGTYACVLYSGTLSDCQKITSTSFICSNSTTKTTTTTPTPNTATTSTSSGLSRLNLNLYIIIPSIFLLMFLFTLLILRLRARSAHLSDRPSFTDIELPSRPTTTTATTSTPTPAPAPDPAHTQTYLNTHVVPTPMMAYPGGVVLHPFGSYPQSRQAMFATNMFPVGIPQTNVVYVGGGGAEGAPQFTPVYVSTVNPQYQQYQ